jgi:drug/metabolite transporter (DMT)-like permease
MLLGLLMALTAALCFGVAMVLQALGAQRHSPAAEGSGLLGTVRAMVNLPFAAGLLLDCFGFVAQLIALRSLPLYVVQAALAGALAVTAVLGAALLKIRLGRAEWLGVAGVCTGLAVLGATAGAEGSKHPSEAFHWMLLAAVAVIAVVGGFVWKLREPVRAAVMGTLCGLGFGVVGLAVRVLPAVHGMDLWPLLQEPATYALLAGGAVSFVFMTEGVRGGKVTTATAAMVLGETALPAVLGVVLLGDRTRPGMLPLAVLGFAVAVAGALALARFGEVSPVEDPAPPAGGPAPAPKPAAEPVNAVKHTVT